MRLDEKELEYVSALLQTCNPLRPDATIRPIDVKLFLQSRYGVRVQEDLIKDLIFRDMAGCLSSSESEDNDLCMDLVQFVSILMIPHFLDPSGLAPTNRNDDQASDALAEQPSSSSKHFIDILSNGMITTPSLSDDNEEGGASMTDEAICSVFSRHGGKKISKSLLTDMVKVMKGSPTLQMP